jgi:Na+-translocating ferredoxin:NAD+ oxidoreductase RnfG subunit
MLKKILAVLAAIGGVFSAIFYVLFRQAKEEKKAERERAERMEGAINAETNAQKKEDEVKKENEKKREKTKGNNLDAFNAATDILCE